MQHIGKILKQIRIDKNITQAVTIKDIGTTTYLSKIENGKINPTYSNLLKILDRLNVSPSEFYRATQISITNSNFEFINRLSTLIREKDTYQLGLEIELENRKFNEDKNFRHVHNKILLNQYIKLFLDLPFDNSQIKTLSNYLLKVRTWGIYEINLYNLCIVFFSDELNQLLYGTVVKSLNKLVTEKEFNSYIVRIGFNILTKLFDSKNITIAAEILKNIESVLAGTKYYYEIVKLKYMQGIFLIIKGDLERGRELTLTAVEIMYKLGDEDNARAHKQELLKYFQHEL